MTPQAKPVMLNGVLVLLLCLSSGRKPDPDLRRCDFPVGWHFSSEIRISPAKNKYTCGRFKKWINTVFQIKSKSVGRETERELSPSSLFYRSEAPQQAEAHSTQIVFVRRNFSVELSPAVESVLMNESWKFEYDTYVLCTYNAQCSKLKSYFW